MSVVYQNLIGGVEGQILDLSNIYNKLAVTFLDGYIFLPPMLLVFVSINYATCSIRYTQFCLDSPIDILDFLNTHHRSTSLSVRSVAVF